MAEPSSDIWVLTATTSGGTRADDRETLADEVLLRRYRQTRAPETFAEMVRRHQPMVLRTCLRLVGNVHDAEDAAQSVLLALAQRPEMVRRSLAGCLHELARAAVSELFRSQRRRSQREEMAARLQSLFRKLGGGFQPMEHHELREELDLALSRLPDSLRQAVILRYLEGHSQKEAAQQAGCTQVTMGWRSMKGLQQLRAILGRRGVVLASSTLATLLTAEAQAGAVMKVASAATGTASATHLASTLVRRFVLGSLLRKAAIAGLVITASLALGAGVVFLPRPARDDPARTPPSEQANAPARTPPSKQADIPAPAPVLGLFDRSLDIGGPQHAGAARFSAEAYTVQGGGQHIYGEKDQFRFVCRPWTGDGEISARVRSDPDQPARQVAAGVMFREQLTPNSHHASILVTSVECHVKFRAHTTDPGTGCDISRLDAPGKQWVRLVRRGNMFRMYVRPEKAENWKLVKEVELVMERALYVGLAVTAHDDAHLATTTFDQVAVR
jgi:RNA polymerase sigma factor (sigma-70 family)